jgi:DNA-binding MarR family transcriptional regulator
VDTGIDLLLTAFRGRSNRTWAKRADNLDFDIGLWCPVSDEETSPFEALWAFSSPAAEPTDPRRQTPSRSCPVGNGESTPIEDDAPDADDLTALAEGLYHAIAKCNAILRRNTSNRVAAGGLTSRQLSLLTTLVQHGPLRVRELAEYEGIRQPSASTGIRSLESLGLIKRSADPTDNRSVLLEASAKGRAAQRAALANLLANGISLLCELNETDREILALAIKPLKRLSGRNRVGNDDNHDTPHVGKPAAGESSWGSLDPSGP